MSIIRTAVPLIVLTSVLTGCAGLQKTDWHNLCRRRWCRRGGIGCNKKLGLGRGWCGVWRGYGGGLLLGPR